MILVQKAVSLIKLFQLHEDFCHIYTKLLMHRLLQNRTFSFTIELETLEYLSGVTIETVKEEDSFEHGYTFRKDQIDQYSKQFTHSQRINIFPFFKMNPSLEVYQTPGHILEFYENKSLRTIADIENSQLNHGTYRGRIQNKQKPIDIIKIPASLENEVFYSKVVYDELQNPRSNTNRRFKGKSNFRMSHNHADFLNCSCAHNFGLVVWN
jgi:hypothetical protein